MQQEVKEKRETGNLDNLGSRPKYEASLSLRSYRNQSPPGLCFYVEFPGGIWLSYVRSAV